MKASILKTVSIQTDFQTNAIRLISNPEHEKVEPSDVNIGHSAQ